MNREMVQFTGYHGTTKPFADSILKDGAFNESTKPREWLGRGIYFFVDREHAIRWAQNQGRRYKTTNCTVLSAKLSCESEGYLDLDRVHNIRRVEHHYKESEKEGMFANGGPTFQSDEELQCFAVNLFRADHPEIKIIAYTFETKHRSIVGFGIKQRQLCACDASVISDIAISQNMLTAKGGGYT